MGVAANTKLAGKISATETPVIGTALLLPNTMVSVIAVFSGALAAANDLFTVTLVKTTRTSVALLLAKLLSGVPVATVEVPTTVVALTLRGTVVTNVAV